MKTLIGHNQPPKRKINWKSISINKYLFKNLVEISEHIHTKNKLSAIIAKKHINTVKQPSIAETIDICVCVYMQSYIYPDYLYNDGKSIFEQTYNQLKRDKDFKQYVK